MRVYDPQQKTFVFDGKTKLQIAHVSEHAQAFDEAVGAGRSVEDYFLDYDHLPQIYLSLCSDLGLEPRPEAIHSTEEVGAALLGPTEL